MKIIMYSANWCSDCVIAKKFLDDQGIIYRHIDINNNVEATELIKKINNGKRVIPTFIINNKTYINPEYFLSNQIIDYFSLKVE